MVVSLLSVRLTVLPYESRVITGYTTFSICAVLFVEILCGLVELHGVAAVWLAESVDEAVCLLDDYLSRNVCVMFPYPCKVFETVGVCRNNRCVMGAGNSNIDPLATEMVD